MSRTPINDAAVQAAAHLLGEVSREYKIMYLPVAWAKYIDQLTTKSITDYDPTLDSHESRIVTLEAGAGIPQVLDLRAAPYNVVANDTSKAATNQTGIKAAFAAVTSPWTIVKFPAGKVYVDKDASLSTSVYLDGATHMVPMILDLRGTILCQYGVGNGGQWTLLECRNGFSAGCVMLGGALQCSRIDNPDPSAFQHYLLHFVNSTGAAYTSNVTVDGMRFGQSMRAAIRFLGEASHGVQNIRITNLDIDMTKSWDGTTITPHGACIEFQRGFKEIEISHGTVKGAHLTTLDMEPTAAIGSDMEGLHFHDLIFDGAGSTATQTVSLGGGGTGAESTRGRMTQCKIRSGQVAILASSNWTLEDCDFILDEANNSDAGNRVWTNAPVVYVYESAFDLKIRNCNVTRTSACAAGPLLYCLADAGTSGFPRRVAVQGGTWLQQTDAEILQTESCAGFAVEGATLRYEGATPASFHAINLKAVAQDFTLAKVDGVTIVSPNGKLAAAVITASANAGGFSVKDLIVRGVQASGQVTTGLICDLNVTAAGNGSLAPLNPVLQGNDFAGCTNDFVASNSAAGHVFPVIAGNRGGVCTLMGTVTPGTVVSAVYGSQYVWINGASSALFFNLSNGTTWTQVTIP